MDINATLLGQMITFAIFVCFTLKFVWPMIQSSMDERKQKILKGLDAAKKGHEKLKEAKDKSDLCFKKTKKQCDTILVTAGKQAAKIVDNARTSALIERDDIVKSGHKQVEQEINKVKIELQKKMAELIIFGAEKVLIKSIKLEDHANIVDKFVRKL